jgi:UDP-glucose 4-epimerase
MSTGPILVTGGAGCIGLEVCRQLQQRGLDVRLFDLPEQILRVRPAISSEISVFYGSIVDMSSLRDAMKDCEIVIHLAAMLGVKRTEDHRLRCLEVNVDGTKNVLDCAVQNRVSKIVFASSSEVYGEPFQNPVDETVPTQGKTVYAVSKLMGEEFCKAFHQRYPSLQYTILRYFNTYGLFHPAQFVVPKFVSNVQKGQPPVIYGEGTQQRSFCFVTDTAEGTIEAALRSEANGEVFNLGNGEKPLTLWELARLVIRLGGKEGELEPVQQRDFQQTDRNSEREIAVRYGDCSKARRILGFQPKVSIEDGIQRMLSNVSIFEQWETPEVARLREPVAVPDLETT